MTLNGALALIREAKSRTERRTVFLACGFQPLHLSTFLAARVAERFATHAGDIQVGLYGDLAGNLDRAARSGAESTAVVIEWSDLDSRLGLRASGGWGASIEDDIVESADAKLKDLSARLALTAAAMPVALALPTLPLPLFGHTPGVQSSRAEASLNLRLAEFAARAAEIAGARLLRSESLEATSPRAARLDAKMELAAGFPYSQSHASVLAEKLVALLFPAGPLKGLITDLDDTLWHGIVGDIGAENVGWTQADHAQIHGLYQQQLRALADLGVLLAVASKNDPKVAEQALARTDLMVPRDKIFPVCAHWEPKSKSVEQILRTWNILPDSVVFVDDSPMELAEVQAAFPSMRGLRFPKEDPAKVVALLAELRDLFGKPTVSREDELRASSIRANAEVAAARESADPSAFVASLQGKVTFQWTKDPSNKRLLELINKTNQFNLNGERISEGDWLKVLADPSSFALAVSYEDKFGPLGIIGVVAGRRDADALKVQSWVLSCRAFSRKIELHTLRQLLDGSGADRIALDFRKTERNGPVQEFLAAADVSMEGPITLARERIHDVCANLPHAVESNGPTV